ncbi:MAG: hypothetical protein JWO30_1335 [Fibrobacteres bacterium]|nr:hypothetical protein [Fibrobacterota bacterium]
MASALVALLLPLAPRAGTAAPAWVERFPYDPDRYVGIGRADKRLHPGDYRDLAQAAALAQISREISVRVQAEEAATRTENGGAPSETYSQRIATMSRNDLAGYRLEDVYETATGFWAFYTLDKEVFRNSLAEKESRIAGWLVRETAALDADLSDRRIQDAADRFARMRKEFETSSPGRLLIGDGFPAGADRLAAASERIRSVVRGAVLAITPSTWTFSMAQTRGHEPRGAIASGGASGAGSAGSASVLLVDGDSRAPWKGPLSLTLADDRSGEAATCLVETDAAGRLDLARPFLDCGLKQGTWEVTWTGPDRRVFHQSVEAAWSRVDLTLDLRADLLPGPGPAPLLAQLKSALESLNSPCYRIVPGTAAQPSLEVRLREFTRDSLDGMYFSSLRADVTVPGLARPVEVRGKAGHADRDRADARAIRDFARGMEGVLLKKE